MNDRTDLKRTSDSASSWVAIAIMSSAGSQRRRDICVIMGGHASQVGIYSCFCKERRTLLGHGD
jgi:hypothetical protein